MAKPVAIGIKSSHLLGQVLVEEALRQLGGWWLYSGI